MGSSSINEEASCERAQLIPAAQLRHHRAIGRRERWFGFRSQFVRCDARALREPSSAIFQTNRARYKIAARSPLRRRARASNCRPSRRDTAERCGINAASISAPTLLRSRICPRSCNRPSLMSIAAGVECSFTSASPASMRGVGFRWRSIRNFLAAPRAASLSDKIASPAAESPTVPVTKISSPPRARSRRVTAARGFTEKRDCDRQAIGCASRFRPPHRRHSAAPLHEDRHTGDRRSAPPVLDESRG